MKTAARFLALYILLTISCKIGFSENLNIPANDSLQIFVIDTLKTYFKKLPGYEVLMEEQKSNVFGRDQYQLKNYLYLLDDKDNSLTIEQIVLPENQKKFKHSSSSQVLLTNYTYWAKLVIQNNLIKENEWAFCPGYSEYVELYISTNGNAFTSKKTGVYVAHDDNDEILTLSNIIEITIPPRKDSTQSITTIYIKYDCTYNTYLQIKPILYNQPILEKQISIYKQNLNLTQGIFQGILWIMVLYCLFTFFFTREKMYLLHSLYAISFSIISLALTDFIIDTVIDSREINHMIPFILAPIFSIIYLLFIIDFLEIKRTHPRLNRILAIANILFCLSIIFSITIFSLTNNWHVQYITFYIISLISAIIILVVIMSLLRKLTVLSLFIVIGSAIFICCTIIYILYSLFYDIRVIHILQLGQVIELLIFLLGLGYRSRLINKEKSESMAALVVQLEENQVLQNKVNRELEGKVKERTIEISQNNILLEQQNGEITRQRDLVEKQHNSIKESIRYAKRIQEAVLQPEDQINKILQENFILFKPRDIVSGDFYWIKQIDNFIIIVAADSTGHGVPGAFMSMLGVSFLNEIVRKKDVTKANEIIEHLRTEIIEALQQKGTSGEQKDGMDIALCVLNTKSNEIQFCGANNNLIIVTGGKEIKEIYSDKMPVAIYENMQPFTNHVFSLQKGDTIYLATDGYADQFGGQDDKKFKISQLKDIFVDISDQPMTEQKNILNTIFDRWKGDREQTDDVTIIGIRIT
jgi:two-component system, sensor histidine kinase LadS